MQSFAHKLISHFWPGQKCSFCGLKQTEKKIDMNMYTDFACACVRLAKQPRFSNTVHIIFKRGFSLMMRGHLLHLLQNCFASFYAKIMSNCKEQSSKKICSKAKFTSFEYTVSATFSAIFWFVDFFWQMANFTDCLDLDFLCTIKRSVELLYVTLLCIQ